MRIICPNCRRGFEHSSGKWITDGPYTHRELDFDSMVLWTRVSGYLDGEASLSQRDELENAWSDDLANSGWTAAEWKASGGYQEFNVRRTPEGRWESRFTWRMRDKIIALAVQALEEGSRFANPGAAKDYEEMMGFTWQRWLNRDKETLPTEMPNPWKPISDDFWPSIETAYQRYIHGAAQAERKGWLRRLFGAS